MSLLNFSKEYREFFDRSHPEYKRYGRVCLSGKTFFIAKKKIIDPQSTWINFAQISDDFVPQSAKGENLKAVAEIVAKSLWFSFEDYEEDDDFCFPRRTFRILAIIKMQNSLFELRCPEVLIFFMSISDFYKEKFDKNKVLLDGLKEFVFNKKFLVDFSLACEVVKKVEENDT